MIITGYVGRFDKPDLNNMYFVKNKQNHDKVVPLCLEHDHSTGYGMCRLINNKYGVKAIIDISDPQIAKLVKTTINGLSLSMFATKVAFDTKVKKDNEFFSCVLYTIMEVSLISKEKSLYSDDDVKLKIVEE